MSEYILIEKGIPIPPAQTRSNIKYGLIVNEMDIGDSVVVDRKNTMEAFRQSMKSKGFVGIARKLENGSYRIWKTESK